MAEFPVVNFAQYQWEVNDQNYLTKWNSFQTAITALQNSINAFGGEVEQELTDTITAVETIRDEEVIPAKNAAQQSATNSAESAAEALQYRNEAQQIAVGDVAITDLQPGTGTQGQMVTPNGSGGLVYDDITIAYVQGLQGALNAKRDVTDTSFKKYDLDVYTSTTYLYVSQYQVIKVSVGANRSLSFLGSPPSGRALTMVVYLYGTYMANYSVTWPSNITWTGKQAPVLDGTQATVVLFWTGNEWMGTLGALS